MRKILIVTLLIFFILPCLVLSFDGNRKGFVGAIGLGAAPYTYWKQNSPELDHSDFGIGFGISTGYGWDNKNTVLFSINGFLHKVDIVNTEYSIFQGFYGVQWTHYFSTSHRSLFTTVGLGVRMFGVSHEEGTEEISGGNRGFGYEAGVGYQFLRNFQARLCYSGGKTGCGDIDYRHHMVYILIENIGF